MLFLIGSSFWSFISYNTQRLHTLAWRSYNKLLIFSFNALKSIPLSSTVKGLFAKTNLPKAVDVVLYDGVAEITVDIIVNYGVKIPTVCRNVQQAVKDGVQNMTNITVSKVNVVVTGVADTAELN